MTKISTFPLPIKIFLLLVLFLSIGFLCRWILIQNNLLAYNTLCDGCTGEQPGIFEPYGGSDCFCVKFKGNEYKSWHTVSGVPWFMKNLPEIEFITSFIVIPTIFVFFLKKFINRK